MDPELIRMAHEAIAAGSNPQAVAAKFRELTGGDLPSPARAMNQTMPDAPELQAQKRIANSTLSPAVGGTLDFLQSVGHGATFGFDDDIAKLFSPEAAATIRQHQQDIDKTAGYGNVIAQGMGGAALPIGNIGTAAKGGAGLIRSALTGAVSGAASGGLYGMGEGEGTMTERLPGAVLPAVAGGIGGGVLGVAGGVVSRQVNNRAINHLGDEIERLREIAAKEKEGIGSQALSATRKLEDEFLRRRRDAGDEIGRLREDVRDEEHAINFTTQSNKQAAKAQNAATDELYALRAGASPLAKEHGFGLESASEAMQAGVEANAAARARSLEETAGLDAARRVREITGVNEPVDVMRAKVKAEKAVVSEQKYQPLHGTVDDPEINSFIMSPEMRRDIRAVSSEVADGKRPPTFTELQELRNRFRGGSTKDRNAFNQIDRMMKRAKEGLIEADTPWAELSGLERQQNDAIKAKNWNASEIRTHLSGLDEPQANAFKETYIENNLIQELLKRDTGSPALKGRIGGGPQMDERIQALMTPEQFNEVKQILVDHRDELAGITRGKDVTVGGLGTQKRGLMDLLEGDRQAARVTPGKVDDSRAFQLRDLLKDAESRKADIPAQRLGAARANEDAKTGALQSLSGTADKINVLAKRQKAMKEATEKAAARIRNILFWGTAAAAGGVGYRTLRLGDSVARP